jgi:hypothetical protein
MNSVSRVQSLVRYKTWDWNALSDSFVRTGRGIILDILNKHPPKCPLASDQFPVPAEKSIGLERQDSLIKPLCLCSMLRIEQRARQECLTPTQRCELTGSGEFAMQDADLVT